MTASTDRDKANHNRPGALSRIEHGPDSFASFYSENVTAGTRFVARRVTEPSMRLAVKPQDSPSESTSRASTAIGSAAPQAVLRSGQWPGARTMATSGQAAAPAGVPVTGGSWLNECHPRSVRRLDSDGFADGRDQAAGVGTVGWHAEQPVLHITESDPMPGVGEAESDPARADLAE